jgi:hypothetical protein
VEARIAGVLYLLVIFGALFIPFAIAPSGMMRGAAAIPTPTAILAAKPAYVLAGVAQLFLGACDIGVALIFYDLLWPVSRALARLAAVFRLIFVAMAQVNLINHFAPLLLLSSSAPAAGLTPDQAQALAMLFLRLRTLGLDIALVFFGFHCLVAGYLFFRSRFVPRVLSLLLMVGGLGYVADIFASFLPAAAAGHLFPWIMLPAGFAEIGLALWLTVLGVDTARWRYAASAAGPRTDRRPT